MLGTLLLTVVVVLAVSTTAVVYVFPEVSGTRDAPVVSLTASVDFTSAAVDHDGGQSVATDELVLVLRRPGLEQRFPFTDGHAASRFEDGDTAMFPIDPPLTEGERVTLLVVHERSNTLLFDGRKYAGGASGEAGDRLVWSTSGDWDAGTDDQVVHDAVGGRSPTRLQLGYAAAGPGADGLVGYYPLDEPDGTLVHDGTDRNDGVLRDDSLRNHVAYRQGEPGVFGTAYEFTPQKSGLAFEKGAYVDLGTGTSPALADGSFTWMAWVKVDEVGGGKEAIVTANLRNRENNILWFLCKRGNSCPAGEDTPEPAYMSVWTNGNFNVDSSGDGRRVRVNDDAWHHVAVTLDADSGRVTYFVDGQRVHSYTTSSRVNADDIMSIAQDTDDEDYGFGTGTSDFFEGSLDEVRLYDRVVTEAELQRMTRLDGTHTTVAKRFRGSVDGTDLSLAGVQADPGSGSIIVYVQADTDATTPGFEAESQPITLTAGSTDYEVEFDTPVGAASYRLRVEMTAGPIGSADSGPTLDRIDLRRSAD